MKPSELIDLNPILTDRVRLAIMTTLYASEDPVEFNSLLDTLDLTKGNLSSHIRKLEEVGFVEVTKEFVDRKPKTTYLCTAEGKKELLSYLNTLENLLSKITKQ